MQDTVEIKKALDWQSAGEFSDILYEKAEGIAKLTINRPRVRNAFRPETVQQLCQASVMPVKIPQSVSSS